MEDDPPELPEVDDEGSDAVGGTEPLTDADLEDVCVGDIAEAGGVLHFDEIAPDFERQDVQRTLERLEALGHVTLAAENWTVTARGRDHYYRPRTLRVQLPGTGEPSGE